MAQAHRIKTDPAVMRAGVFRFLNRIARESGFWLLAALALGMIAALATFNPADPAWTHTCLLYTSRCVYETDVTPFTDDNPLKIIEGAGEGVQKIARYTFDRIDSV